MSRPWVAASSCFIVMMAGGAHAQVAPPTAQVLGGAYVGAHPLPSSEHTVAYRRNLIGLGLELARTPERGWIGRFGGVIENAFACGLGEGWSFEVGCGASDAAPTVGRPHSLGDAVGDRALHARVGWSFGTLALEVGAIARSDSFRTNSPTSTWLLAPDLVARLSGTRGELELGGGAYALPTIASPGLWLRGRVPIGRRGSSIAVAFGRHEFGPWGEHPHFRFDLEALGYLGRGRARLVLGGGVALLHARADGVSSTTMELRITVGVAF